MNLSDYIGQTITVRLRNGESITFTVRDNNSEIYPVGFYNETYTDDGRLYADTTSGYDIVEIISSNSNSSNNMNSNTQPETIQDFIDLFTAVKKEYGNIVVRHSCDRYESSDAGCRNTFYDILVTSGCKSLIRSDNYDAVEKPALVFVT